MAILMYLRNTKFSPWFNVTAATVFFLPFLLFFRFIGGTWLVSNHDYPSYNRTIIVVGSILILWLLYKLISGGGFYITELEVYLVPFIVVVIISTIFSENQSLSIEKALGIGIYFLIGVILVDIRRNNYLWDGLINALLVVAFITTIISCISIGYVYSLYRINLDDILGNFSYVLKILPRMPNIANLHSTISACYYLMVFPLALYRLKQKTKLSNILIGAGSLLSIGIFILIKSRGSIIGVCFMIITSMYLLREKYMIGKDKFKYFNILVTSLVIIVLILGVSYIFSQRGLNLTDINVICRFQAWKISLTVIKTHILFGSGLETFGAAFLQNNDMEICPAILHVTHNDLLQIAVNFGLAGVISLGYFLYKYAGALSNKVLEQEDFRLYGFMAFAGVAGMGLVTTTIYSSNIVFLIMFYLVWLFPLSQIKQIESNWKFLSIMIGASLLFGSAGIWISWKLEPYYRARMYAIDYEWELASQQMMIALQREPQFPYYQRSLAFTEGQEGCREQSSRTKALEDYQSVSGVYKKWDMDHINSAILFGTDGKYSEAINELSIAVGANPNNSLSYCMLGNYQLSLGQVLSAEENLASCIALRPAWLDTYFWYTEIEGRVDKNRVLDKAEQFLERKFPESVDTRMAEIYYYMKEYPSANRILALSTDSNSSDQKADLIKAKIEYAQGENLSARNAAESLIQKEPRCRDCWLLKAELEREEGNLIDAKIAIDIYNYLGGSEASYLFLSEILWEKGMYEEANNLTERILDINPPSTNFSHWVASRWHMPSDGLACLPIEKPYSEYYGSILAAGEKLESYSCFRAACFYARAAKENPQFNAFEEEYFQLPCTLSSTLNDCTE